ncbi:MAG: Type 1 glutamine amidotransferase-like domain-containing protein [Actinomycetota bacterium]
MSAPEDTKHTLLMLGSGEFEPWAADVEREALARATGDGTVLIVPTASVPDRGDSFSEWARIGLDHYAWLGVPAKVLPLKTREDAVRGTFVGDLARVSMIFFSGGKPRYLSSVLDGTPTWDAIVAALRRGAVYAGCSAGAMVASQVRIDAGGGRRGQGWVHGLGLVPHVSFGVHWDKMRFIPGLRPFVMSRVPTGSWFVGIDERTGVLGNGERWRVFGGGTVMTRQGRDTMRYHEAEEFETRWPRSMPT